MDPLDLTLEQSYHETDIEIEHWCPVCDRLIQPAQAAPPTPAAGAASPALDNNNNDTESPLTPQSQISSLTTLTASTNAPPTPVHKRRPGQARRPMLNRSRTSLQSKKRPAAAAASNPNFLQDLVTDFALSTQNNGSGGDGGVAPSTETAPRSKTSSMSHSDNATANANHGEDLPAQLRTSPTKAPKTNDSDLPESREGVRSAGVIKRKASAPDVNALGPRLRPLTKSRLSGKPRPKSLNLVIAQELDLQGDVGPKTSKAPVSSPVEQRKPLRTGHDVEDLRRRLYCSEECYNIDLRGHTFDARTYHSPTTPVPAPAPITSPKADAVAQRAPNPSPKFQDYPTAIKSPLNGEGTRPFEVKRNLSCEMPWLWTNNMHKSRRMAPTRNSSWVVEADTEDNGNESNDSGLYRRRVASTSQVHALRKLTPAFNRSRLDSARSLPSEPLASFGSPTQNASPTLEGEKSPHRLFFRRMPGKIDATSVVMPPLFVVDGHWTETPPPGFDYAGFMAERERERRRRQIEITEAMLLKKGKDEHASMDEVVVGLAGGAVDTVTKRHHDSARRKKRADTERSQYERKMQTVHAPAYHEHKHAGPRNQQPWWHLDEREDWKAYWAARDNGDVEETVSWEMWQLRRHHERVARVEREEALKRAEGERLRVQADVANAVATAQKRTSVLGDRKKVAKRPFLIRVASQPTTSDVDLVAGLYEEGEKRMNWIKEQQLQRATAVSKERTTRSSSSSETSPLGMNRTKALPVVLSRNNSVSAKSEPAAGTPSSFMRGHTLCIPGFVVEEKEAVETVPKSVVPPSTQGFVFPLVAVPGSVEAASTVIVPGTARSPPPRRLPPGLALPASALIGTVPTISTLADPPCLRRPDSLPGHPQLKKSNTLPIDPSSSQPPVSSDAAALDLNPRRRVQSLEDLTLTLPDPSANNAKDAKRSSLVIPRSPLGLHSFSAAELPIVESRGRKSTNTGRSGGASSVSGSSATRSKQGDGSSGSQRRLTLEPRVDFVTATATTSLTYPYNSLGSLRLTQLGLPTDLAISGSPEIVTAVSGVGSGSGSSGEESTWSRAEVRLERNATVKVASTMNLPRIQRSLALTKVRPNSMGPLEPNSEGVPNPANVGPSNEPVACSPLSYSASLLRCYSEFRSGSVPNGTQLPPSPSVAASTEKAPPVGKRRSLWGIFGSAKP